jgi:UDP-GlcNAc:undecaprenyl-phosphate/decaprenyl-phosphate GlcNAc-1-phosphate transferase
MWFDLLIFATALLICGVLTPVAALVAHRFGFIDQPAARKVHSVPTPRLGGLAIYVAILGAILFVFAFRIGHTHPGLWAEVLGILGGGTILVVIGVLDDRGYVHSLTKLFIGMPLAALTVAASGIRTASLLDYLLSGHALLALGLSLLLTTLWIVVITSAFSILDYMDGMCAGIAAIAAAFFLICALIQGQILVSLLTAAILGASLGFLLWNLSPARIFMGDSGPLFLGFLIATLAIKLRFAGLPQIQSWIIPVLILAVPIFDMSLVTLSRLRRRLNPFTTPGKDHTGHRLADLGLGKRGAILVMYAASIAGGLLALLVPHLPVLQSHILFAAVFLAGIVGLVVLEHVFSLMRRA